MNGFCRFFLPAFLITSLISTPADAATKASLKGWMLEQKHAANGHQIIYVFPEKLRVENTDIGNTLIADEQSGKVWVFSDRRKLACCVDWNRFEHSFSKMMQVGGENTSKLSWKLSKEPEKTVVAGLATRAYKASDEKLYFKGGGGGFMSGGSKHVKVSYTSYIAETIPISPRNCKVLAEMQTMAVLGGVPLRGTLHREGRVRTDLDTISAKQVPNDNKLWAVPKYKLAASVGDVTNVTDEGFIQDLLGKP